MWLRGSDAARVRQARFKPVATQGAGAAFKPDEVRKAYTPAERKQALDSAMDDLISSSREQVAG
jgi:hypothetical protein